MKMKKILLNLILVLSVSAAFAQNNAHQWAVQMGGASTAEGHAVVTDADGNIYSTGYVYGTVDFDPGPGVANITSVVGSDIYVQKLDSSGNFIWAQGLISSAGCQSNSMAIDASGNIYITGFFLGTMDFDPGAGTQNRTAVGFRDVFVLKLTSAGAYSQVYTFGGTVGDDRGKSVAVDPSGNVYVTGYYSGTVNFDPVGTYNLTAFGTQDIFVAKFSASSSLEWAYSFGAGSQDVGISIVANATGVYTLGNFDGTIDFDPGVGTSSITSSSTNNTFLQKLSPAGNFEWVSLLGGNVSNFGNFLAFDPTGSSIYTTGKFFGTVDFDPLGTSMSIASLGSADAFIQKIDVSDGSIQWVKTITGTGYESGSGISTDASGNIYTIGTFVGTGGDFDPGTGVVNLTPAGQPDIYIQKLDASGNFIWAKGRGGSLTDQAYALAISSTNQVITTGIFEGTADFDPGTGTYFLTANGYDAFVHLLAECSTPSTVDTISSCGSHTWIDGITYSANNNTAIDTITRSNGCDSIVTLNLTILNSSAGTDIQSACESYTWIDGNAYLASNDTVTHTIIGGAANGCDSIVTLDLTINVASSASIDTTITKGTSFTIGTSTYDTAGTYTDTLINAQNCDSIVTTNLSVFNGIHASLIDGLNVYPNPTQGEFVLEMRAVQPLLIVKLYSAQGQLIQSKTVTNTNRIELSINEVPGIYLLNVADENGGRISLNIIKN